jgi:tetratricopeptide (TPR) repeat protein
MYCNQCGAEVSKDARVCPSCGHRLVAALGLEPEANLTAEPVDTPSPDSGSRGCGWAMLAGMAAGLAILVIVALALLGVYQGVQERTRLNRAAAVEHYQKGLEQLALENYELARAEFELAAQLDSSNRDAVTKLADVNALISSQPTATSAFRRQTVILLYNEARELYNRSDWEGVISKLEQVRTLDPEYEREPIVSLLVEAYNKAGLRLVEGDRMEEAIRYFDRALELQPTDATAREQKRWASLYLAGLGYWGADWLGAVESFSVLYQLKPDYKDTRQRLYDAYVAYADTLYEGGDWCAARDHYDSALALIPSEALKAKREEAEQNCAIAPGSVGTPPPSGTFVGRLSKVEDVGREEAMMIRGYVFDAECNPLPGVQVGLSAWDWSAAPATTSAVGIFAFDGLANPVTYTVTLADLPHVPLPVKADWSKLVWVEFRPQP